MLILKIEKKTLFCYVTSHECVEFPFRWPFLFIKGEIFHLSSKAHSLQTYNQMKYIKNIIHNVVKTQKYLFYGYKYHLSGLGEHDTFCPVT